MARLKPSKPAPDTWATVLFALCAVTVVSGGFLSSAVLSQSQTFDAWAVLMGISGLIGCAAILAGGYLLFPRTRLGVAWTLFLGWALIAALVSGRALNAFVGEPTNMLGMWTLAALAAVIGAAGLRGGASRALLEKWSPWLIVVQCAFSALGLALVMGGGPINWDLAARGTLPNSSALGEVIVLLVPWTISGSYARRSKAQWRFHVGAAIAAIVVLAVGRSRVALAVAVLWGLWVLIERTSLQERARRFALGAIIAVCLLLTGAYAALQLGVVGGGQLGLRPEFTRIGIRAMVASPLVGYGPDGFIAGGAAVSSRETVAADSVLVFSRGATDPHNILLWIGVSMGAVGLALFVWLLVEMALGWRERARAGVDVVPGVWAVVGAFVVFATAPATISVLPLFAFVTGVSLSARPRERMAGARRVAGYVALGALTLGAALLTANAMTRFPLDNPGAQASARLAPGAQRAADVWAVDPHLAYLASIHWGWVAQADPNVAAARPDLAAIAKAVRLDRRDPLIALEYARTLRFYRESPAAVEAAFRDAIERWPLHPVARVELSQYLEAAGSSTEARKVVSDLEGLNLNDPALMAEVERLLTETGGQQ